MYIIEEIFEQGLIPNDGETEDLFLRRAGKIKECFRANANKIDSKRKEEPLYSNILHDYPFTPIIFSKKNLSFFEAGAFFYEEKSPSLGYIQINPTIEKSFLSWLYDKEEVVKHEIVHAMRAPFPDSCYEEILAYSTSKNFIRRKLGPLFFSPAEPLVFLLSIILSIGSDLASIFFNIESAIFLILSYFPLAFLLGLSVRLYLFLNRLKKCKKRLYPFLKNKSNMSNLLIRLKGEEISFFAQSSINAESFIEEKANRDLRWKLLKKLFLIE